MPLAWFTLGALALVLLLMLARGFANASIEQVKKAAMLGAAAIGTLLTAVLLATGRGGQVFYALAFFGPALWRWWQGRRLARHFAQPGLQDRTEVRTATLAMALDHTTGSMTGHVLRGAYAGADLASLPLDALRAMLVDCAAADPESIPLLEAWLDRAHPNWRADTAPPPGVAALTRADALAILGLAEGASEPEIRAAHRRLMRSAHPDRGGSDWLAARLNAARDLLLGA